MKITSSKNNYQFSDNEYGFITLSENQNTGLANTNPIKLDTLVGNVTFNPVTYQITLKKNRTYRLFASFLAGYSGNTGLFDFRFYNVTAGTYIGTTADQLVMTYTAHAGTQPNAFVILTPTVDTVIELRIVSPTALSLIYAAYSYVEVQQINIVSPVIQMPYLSTSKQVNLTVTSAAAGFAVTRAVGVFYKDSNEVWRLKANITVAITAATSLSMTISGVTFNTSSGYQSGCGWAQNGGYVAVRISNSDGTIYCIMANSTYVCISLDCELASKPTLYI